MKIERVSRVSSPASHAAFTDLIASNDGFLCCYRQATNHVSGDGIIVIATLNHDGKVLSREYISVPDTDLRDPKLSSDANGRIWLIAFARFQANERGHSDTAMVSWFTDTGYSWSSAHRFGESHWWLWRIGWGKKHAYGFAYHRGLNQLDLCVGHPHKQMFRHPVPAMSLAKHGLGYPNESALIIDDNEQITALVRRDADSFTAQLGQSKPPFQQWHWKSVGDYIGGPAMVSLTGNYALVAGRKWTGKKLNTQLWVIELSTATLTPLITLPSAGDNSYPGLVLQGDTLFMSYYSGHMDNQTRVYFAEISGLNALRRNLTDGAC